MSKFTNPKFTDVKRVGVSDTLYQERLREQCARMVRDEEAVYRDVLPDLSDEELVRRCHFEVNDAGARVLVLDGEPLVTMYPVAFEQVAGRLIATQRYEVHQ